MSRVAGIRHRRRRRILHLHFQRCSSWLRLLTSRSLSPNQLMIHVNIVIVILRCCCLIPTPSLPHRPPPPWRPGVATLSRRRSIIPPPVSCSSCASSVCHLMAPRWSLGGASVERINRSVWTCSVPYETFLCSVPVNRSERDAKTGKYESEFVDIPEIFQMGLEWIRTVESLHRRIFLPLPSPRCPFLPAWLMMALLNRFIYQYFLIELEGRGPLISGFSFVC